MATSPRPVGPIDMTSTLDAMAAVESHLDQLLGTLTPAEWRTPTIVKGWEVRHVAAHLLDTASRKLAIVRDGFFTEAPASGSPADVRAFVDRLNAEGVRAYGRLSPAVVRTLMAPLSRQLCDYHRTLDPMAPAAFAVSWAGEQQSANWFDVARELTERWHHQAQMRLALGRPPLFTRALYHPVLDCFMRVLPYAFRDVPAADGTLVSVVVNGEGGGEWQLYRDAGEWMLTSGLDTSPAARIELPEAVAWRVFTKGLDAVVTPPGVAVIGDPRLAATVLSAVAIVG